MTPRTNTNRRAELYGHATHGLQWFAGNAGAYFKTSETMGKRRKPFTVDYTGFGWVLIKKGVFENLEYPWFAPQMQVFESGEVQDMCGEDVSFCLDAKKMGMEIWCDPRIRVESMKKLGLFEIRVSGSVYSVTNEDDALDKLQDLDPRILRDRFT